MQRARSARATNTATVRACVGDLLMFEETVDVDEGDFAGWLGQGESTAGSRRSNDQIRLRQSGENLREKGPLQSARVGDLGDRELCLPTVITLAKRDKAAIAVSVCLLYINWSKSQKRGFGGGGEIYRATFADT